MGGPPARRRAYEGRARKGGATRRDGTSPGEIMLATVCQLTDAPPGFTSPSAQDAGTLQREATVSAGTPTGSGVSAAGIESGTAAGSKNFRRRIVAHAFVCTPKFFSSEETNFSRFLTLAGIWIFLSLFFFFLHVPGWQSPGNLVQTAGGWKKHSWAAALS